MGNIPPPWSPCPSTRTEGPCSSRRRLLGGLGGLKRFSCPAVSASTCILPFSHLPLRGEGKVLAMRSVSAAPQSLTQPPAGVGGTAPRTQLCGGPPAVVSPVRPWMCWYLHQDMCGLVSPMCPACRYQLCWHPSGMYGTLRDAPVAVGVATGWMCLALATEVRAQALGWRPETGLIGRLGTSLQQWGVWLYLVATYACVYLWSWCICASGILLPGRSCNLCLC